MRPSIKYALREQGVSNANTKRIYCNSIFAVTWDLVKKKYERVSISFWRTNYIFEENRREHAALGYLWKQIGYCIALLVFRAIGKVV